MYTIKRPGSKTEPHTLTFLYFISDSLSMAKNAKKEPFPITSRVVKFGVKQAPLGKGFTQADEYYRGLEQKYGIEEAKRIWRETSI
jgi:hypothetical protein